MACCILKDLPKSLWAEAVAWSTYTKNQILHSTISFKTPYEVFHSQQPSLNHLKAFGTPCVTHIMPEDRPAGSKLLPRGREGIICGYTKSNKLYQVYLKDTQQVKVSRDVTFPSTSVGEESAPIPEVPDAVTEVNLDFKPEESTQPSVNPSSDESLELLQEVRTEDLPPQGNIEVLIPQLLPPSWYPA